MNDHQQITSERGRRAADLRAAAVAMLEQQTIAAGVMLDLDSDQVVAAGPKAAILYLLSNGAPATASGDERADFEAWARANCGMTDESLGLRESGHYAWGRTQDMWEAYQAAVSAATKPTADLSVAVLRLLNHIEDVVSDAEWQKINAKLWNAVSSLLATKPAAAPAAKVIINDGKGTATVLLAPAADLKVGTSLYATPAASTPAAPVENKHLPGWERGISTVTLSGHQLRMALDLINPDGPSDDLQMDDELTFGIVQHKDDAGTVSTGMCCWNGDTDGVLPLDGEYTATPAASTTGAAQTAEQVRKGEQA